MTFNTTPRRRFSKKQRAEFFLKHKGICHLCGKKIDNEEWDIEHIVAREIMGPLADSDSNLAPIHRDFCHKRKTAMDRRAIAKANRIQKRIDGTAKRGKQIQSKGFSKKWRKKMSGEVVAR